MNQEESKAVESLLLQYSNALNSSNAEQLVSLYMPGGVFMPNLGRTIKGTEEIRQSAAWFLKQSQISITFEVKDVVFEGNFAFVQATSNSIVHRHKTGNEVKETTKDFFVLQKELLQWKVFRYTFNN